MGGGGTCGQRLRRGKRLQPGEECGGFESEIDETGPRDADLVGIANGGGEGGDELFGGGAGVEFARLGVAERAVGLKVAMLGVGGAHLGGEGGGVRQSGRSSGGPQGRVEVDGKMESDVHSVRKRNRAAGAQAWSWRLAWPRKLVRDDADERWTLTSGSFPAGATIRREGRSRANGPSVQYWVLHVMTEAVLSGGQHLVSAARGGISEGILARLPT